MAKDLSYFMGGGAEEEIIQIPAPDKKKYRDKDGNLIMLEVRRLKAKRIQKIRENCTTRRIALDGKKRPIINNGEVVYETRRDPDLIVKHTLVEALVYPDLQDKALKDAYGCANVADMPMNVFSGNDEYDYIVGEVFRVLGITGGDDDENEVEEAKN